MARKTQPAKGSNKNPTPRRAIDDNFVAPKRTRKKADTTLAEALAAQAAEEGKTVEEVQEELAVDTTVPPAADRPTREAGMSNLAQTIRSHRNNYQPMLHPNGKKTQNNGDAVAVLLLTIPLDTLKDYSGVRFNGRRYDQLNPGHARMCIGNLIRAAFKKGETDVVEWLYEHQPKTEDAPEADTKH